MRIAYFGHNDCGVACLQALVAEGYRWCASIDLKSFFDDVPKELDESAMLDGATRLDVFRMVVLPLVNAIVVAPTAITPTVHAGSKSATAARIASCAVYPASRYPYTSRASPWRMISSPWPVQATAPAGPA